VVGFDHRHRAGTFLDRVAKVAAGTEVQTNTDSCCRFRLFLISKGRLWSLFDRLV
jgi:hypothetical protein